MEGRIALALLCAPRFDRMQLAVTPGELRWRDGVFLRGFEALPVTFGAADGRPARA